MRELSVRAFKADQDAGVAADWQVVDVREPWEHALCSLAGSRLLPMQELPQRLHELDPMRTTVVVCHHGVRSANVVNWLRGQGIAACQSMAGGIDQWSLEIDASVPRY